MSTTSTENLAKHRTILVVDDEPNVRELIQFFLVPEGVSCAMAGSVKEACSHLQRGLFALTLLDWRLDRSGIEVLRFCRERHPRMPVIVMSGISPEVFDVRTDALVTGADSFLEKPFNAPALVGHIKRWFEWADATSQPIWPHNEQEIIPFEQLKISYIQHVVELLHNNISLAAEKLHMHRHTIASVFKIQKDAYADKTVKRTI